MSIATLKRKNAAQHQTMSTGHTQFSLNGTYRSQGYIGQTYRSAPRTLMHGDAARGGGGCCGTYPTTANVVPPIISQNDPTVVKSSVLSSRGRIAKRYPWITGGSTPGSGFDAMYVKPDATHALNTQSAYIDSVVSLANITTTNCKDVKAVYSPEMCNFVAEPSATGAISQSSYLRNMNSRNCNTSIPRFFSKTVQTPINICAEA
jgi:hypothetical protein